MKNKISTLALTLILAQSANAGFFSKKHKPKEPQPQVDISSTLKESKAPSDEEVLAPLLEKMKASFSSIDQKMKNNEFGAALGESKLILDEVRKKTGIDPKSNKKEIVSVPSGTFSREYKTLGQSLSQFSLLTQNNIIDQVQGLRGSLYLDLLNLLKRTNLVYIQASYEVYKQQPGGTLKSDNTKIINDLIGVLVIPIYLLDPSQPTTPLVVFDSEIANSDQNDWFNREIKFYLIDYMAKISSDLGLQASNHVAIELEIDRLIEAKKISIKQAFIQAQSATQVESQVNSSNANPFKDANYKACYDLYYKQYNSARSSNVCIESYKKLNYKNPVFNSCYTTQYKTLNSSNSISACIKYATF